MRRAQLGLLALILAASCTRYGYEVSTGPVRDAALQDARVAGEDAGSDEDAGADDAGTTDGGPIELCPERPDVLFCDGFEDPNFTRWSYPRTVNGTVEQASSPTHSGVGSLHSVTGAAGDNNEARYGVKIFGGQKTGEIWVRAFYFIPLSVVVNTSFSTIVVAENVPPYFGFSLSVRPTGVDITQGNTWYRSATVFPRDTWTCVEMHIKVDATANGIVEAFLDGARVVNATNIVTLPATGYTSFDVGIHYTDPGQGPVELYVDDAAAGHERIGCTG